MVKIDKKVIVQGTVFVTWMTVLTQLIAFICVPFVVANLGIELYGLWVVTELFVSYSNSLDYALVQGMQRYVALANNDSKLNIETVYSTGFLCLVIFGCLIGLVIILCSGLFIDLLGVDIKYHEDARSLLLLSAFQLMLTWPLRMSHCVLEASMYLKTVSFLTLIRSSLATVTLLTLALCGFHIVFIKIGCVITHVFSAILMLLVMLNHFKHIRFNYRKIEFNLAKDMVVYSGNYMYLQLVNMVGIKSIPVLLTRMDSIASVAYFDILNRIFRSSLLLGNQVTKVLNVTAFNLSASKDKRRLGLLVERGVKYRVFAMMPISIVLFICSSEILTLWLGERFTVCSASLKLLSIVCMIMPWGVYASVSRASGYTLGPNILITLKQISVLFLSILFIKWGFEFNGPVLAILFGNLLFGDILMGALCSRKIGAVFSKTGFFYIKTLLVWALFVYLLDYLIRSLGVEGVFYLIIVCTTIIVLFPIFCVIFLAEKKDISDILKHLSVVEKLMNVKKKREIS